jgi:flavin reductase (DIM6/NTAB) family NADH-FMN oxidoreductase RutF
VRADRAAGNAESFDEQVFREALGCFATGVTVITTQGVTHPYGMTANAFSSVSLDPPLVLVCVESGREGSRSIQANGVFAVNVLGTHQEELSRFFASVERPRGSTGFAGIGYGVDRTGSPVLDDIVAHFDCHLVAAYEAGDHIIFIGQVLSLGMDPEREPLLFHRGKYSSLPRDAE